MKSLSGAVFFNRANKNPQPKRELREKELIVKTKNKKGGYMSNL